MGSTLLSLEAMLMDALALLGLISWQLKMSAPGLDSKPGSLHCKIGRYGTYQTTCVCDNTNESRIGIWTSDSVVLRILRKNVHGGMRCIQNVPSVGQMF